MLPQIVHFSFLFKLLWSSQDTYIVCISLHCYLHPPIFRLMNLRSLLYLCLLVSALVGATIAFAGRKPILTLRNKSNMLLSLFTICVYSSDLIHAHSVIRFLWLGGFFNSLYLVYIQVYKYKAVGIFFTYSVPNSFSWLTFLLKFNIITCSILCQMLMIFKYRTYSMVHSLFSSNLLSKDDEVTYKVCFLSPHPVLKSFLDLILSNYA